MKKTTVENFGKFLLDLAKIIFAIVVVTPMVKSVAISIGLTAIG